MRIRNFASGALLGLVLLASAASAEVGAGRAALKLEPVRAQQAQIRAGVQAQTGIFRDLSATSRDELLRTQEQMLRLIDDKNSTDELTESQKDEVFNSLEMIEAIVNKAEDDREVCERVARLGSNRKERVCRTVAQMRQDRERAQLELSNSGSQRIR